jgi:ribonuclease HI
MILNSCEELLIYTDGSFVHASKFGGWSAVFVYNQEIEIGYNHGDIGNNNLAEFKAVLFAVSLAPPNINVIVRTDSSAVIHKLQNENLSNVSIFNTEHLTSLEALAVNIRFVAHKFNSISYELVTGHGDDKFNIMADALAYKAWASRESRSPDLTLGDQ